MDKVISDDKTVSISLEKLSEIIVQNWTALALCHDCSIQEKEDGIEEYIGMSPDSIELVRAARLQGYRLKNGESSKFRKIITGFYKDITISKKKTIDETKTVDNMNIYINKKDSSNNSNAKEFEILNIIAFSSDRKRESVIVKEKNIIKLYKRS